MSEVNKSNRWRRLIFPFCLAYFILCLFLGGYPFNIFLMDSVFNVRFSVLLLTICLLFTYGVFSKFRKNVVLEIVVAGIILIVGAYVRFRGISETVLSGPTVDEPLIVVPVLNMLRTGSLDYKTYEYGGVWFYILLAVFIVFGIRGTATFRYRHVSQISDQAYYVAGRYAAAFFSLLTVGATYAIARRFFGKLAAAVAASVLALSYLSFTQAHEIRLDHVLTLFVIVAHYFFLRILKERSTLNYVFAGLFTGLALATKYTLLPLFLSLILAHVFAQGRSRWLDWNLVAAFVAAVLVYVLFNAAALFHFNELYTRLSQAVFHNLTPEHWSHQANRPLYNSRILLFEGVGILAAFPILLTFIQMLYRTERRLLLLWCFPILHLAMLNSYASGFPRYLLPVIPNLAILAGEGTRQIFAWIILKDRIRIASATLAVAMVFLICAFPAYTAFRHYQIMDQRLKPQTVISWIELNIPPGAKIFSDPTGPLPPASKYKIQFISANELKNLQTPTTDQYICVTEDLFKFVPNDFQMMKEFPAQTKNQDRYIRIYKNSL